jgi:hypothetical protein
MGPQVGQIVDFIAREAGLRTASVTLSTRLLQDVRMDGDDAVDFFEAFGKKFNVDLDRLWKHWHHHFAPEGIFQGLPGLEIEITVQDLIDSAHAGRWLKSYRGESSR